MKSLTALGRGCLLTTRRECFSGPVMVNMARILTADNTFLCSRSSLLLSLLPSPQLIKRWSRKSSAVGGKLLPRPRPGPAGTPGGRGQADAASLFATEGSCYEDFRERAHSAPRRRPLKPRKLKPAREGRVRGQPVQRHTSGGLGQNRAVSLCQVQLLGPGSGKVKPASSSVGLVDLVGTGCRQNVLPPGAMPPRC
nr:uncharacterized protein LOC125183594 isoform X2 [Anser cygnoides]